MAERCETCRFWLTGDSDVASGLCRRRAPQMPMAPRGVFRGVFPEVSAEDWCGEWEDVRRGHAENATEAEVWRRLKEFYCV